MKYLGIDYGSKRVGLAISDAEGRLAFPYSVISNDKKLLVEIEKIISKKKIEAIVIGESKDFKDKPNEIMAAIEKFKKLLEEKTGCRVFFEPEFMTSKQAEHVQGKNRMLDASAAAIILQSFLDKKTIMV